MSSSTVLTPVVRTFTAAATDDCGNSHSVYLRPEHHCQRRVGSNAEPWPRCQPIRSTSTSTAQADLTPAMMPGVEAADNCDSDVLSGRQHTRTDSCQLRRALVALPTVGASLDTVC